MTMDRLLIAGAVLVALAFIGLQFTDDGMARCQLSHSFDVCHDAIY